MSWDTLTSITMMRLAHRRLEPMGAQDHQITPSKVTSIQKLWLSTKYCLSAYSTRTTMSRPDSTSSRWRLGSRVHLKSRSGWATSPLASKTFKMTTSYQGLQIRQASQIFRWTRINRKSANSWDKNNEHGYFCLFTETPDQAKPPRLRSSKVTSFLEL